MGGFTVEGSMRSIEVVEVLPLAEFSLKIDVSLV